MAKIKSAQKQARQNSKRRAVNVARQTAIKTAIKKFVAASEASAQSSPEQLTQLLRDVESKMARAAQKGVFYRNTVKRKISRLTKHLAQALKPIAS